MRIAIISDTHIGDTDCALVPDEINRVWYDKLIALFGGNEVDYLVLLGDIFDFSMGGYKRAYSKARIFFNKFQTDVSIGEIIYVPGNHDYAFWQTVEHQVNVINRFGVSSDKMDEGPRDFRWSVPGVLDAEKNLFIMPDVKRESGGYGGLFLEGLTPGIKWNVAYPNVYLVTKDSTVLLTHGHYFEPFWAIGGEWVPLMMEKEDMGQMYTPITEGDKGSDRYYRVGMRDLVALNSPLSQLACSGIGQAGAISYMASKIQRSATYDPRLSDIKTYLDKLNRNILEDIVIEDLVQSPIKKYIGKKAVNKVIDYTFNNILEYLEVNVQKSAKAFPEDHEKRMTRDYINAGLLEKERRIRFFFAAVKEEIERVRQEYSEKSESIKYLAIEGGGQVERVKERIIASGARHPVPDLPYPSEIIYGHTHHPVGWNEKQPSMEMDGELVLHNTGGWLEHEGKFCGAEVFIYDGDKMDSISVS